MAKKQRQKAIPLGCVVVDIKELTAICVEKGYGVETVLEETKLSHHTIERIRKGVPIRPSTLKCLLQFLGPQHLGRISTRVGPQSDSNSSANARNLVGQPIEEWHPEQPLTGWITTSNGLQFQVVKMRHLELSATWGRGKCYDLSYLSDETRLCLREKLRRHPTVCRLLPPSPRIPINERTFLDPKTNHWWVIDSWIDGVSLADILGKETLPLAAVLRIGREMAEGLKLLHDHGIVRRELSPKFILLREPDRSVVLTDFELAKLLNGGPTVSEDWPVDLYRAPEVAEGDVDARVDLYSWGRIVLFAALGILPAVGKEKAPLHGSKLPEALIDLLVSCVALPRSDRPNTMDEVLSVLESLR